MSQQPVPGTGLGNPRHGAGRPAIPYLALHPMGFSVPPGLRLERWALAPPFHPYPALSKFAEAARPFIVLDFSRIQKGRGGLFSVALSVRRPHGQPSRVYPSGLLAEWPARLRGIAPSGVRTFLPPGITRESDSPPFQNQHDYRPKPRSNQEALLGRPLRPLDCAQPSGMPKSFFFCLLIFLSYGFFPGAIRLPLNPYRACNTISGRNCCR